MTAVSVYLRSHYWDTAVAHCLGAASEALGAPVTLAADLTAPFALPEGLPVLRFRRDDFPARGLPLLPQPDRALWYNGDYVLALIAETDPADAILMMDGDCCVNGLDLRALIARLTAEGVDFCAPLVADCVPDRWQHWAGIQRDWFRAELGEAPGLRLMKSFFPFVWLSRRAILHLRDRRQAMARLKAEGCPARWPQCESFVPSELARLPGFRLAALEDLVTGPMHMTFLKPIGLSELPGVDALLVHPLLTGARLGQKLVASVAEIARDDPARQMQLLRRALRRPIDPAARRVLRAEVATASRPR